MEGEAIDAQAPPGRYAALVVTGGPARVGPMLALRASGALMRANCRYWPRLARLVGDELAVWEERARSIGDPTLRGVALASLREKRLNVQTAAVLATLAPRAHRRDAAMAMVTCQVLCDYLDLLTEQPLDEPLADRRRLFRAFTDAVGQGMSPVGGYYRTGISDGGYLDALVKEVGRTSERLPSWAAVARTASHVAHRNAEAQIRFHGSRAIGDLDVEAWAIRASSSSALGWREFLSGAAGSVLCLHALFAAAANPQSTDELAERIDAAYMPICTAAVLTDSVVDYESDLGSDGAGFIRFYRGTSELRHALIETSHAAVAGLRTLPHPVQHAMIFAGALAYYASEPGCHGETARPVVTSLRRELGLLIAAPSAVMRLWRVAKRIRGRGPSSAETRSPLSAIGATDSVARSACLVPDTARATS